MRHHGDALVLPKVGQHQWSPSMSSLLPMIVVQGFYGHEVRYENQMKIIQDPVSGQILPEHLLDYWWSQVVKLNEANTSINNLKRVLNNKELKEEFAEIFSQKGCNKSVVRSLTCLVIRIRSVFLSLARSLPVLSSSSTMATLITRWTPITPGSSQVFGRYNSKTGEYLKWKQLDMRLQVRSELFTRQSDHGMPFITRWSEEQEFHCLRLDEINGCNTDCSSLWSRSSCWCSGHWNAHLVDRHTDFRERMSSDEPSDRNESSRLVKVINASISHLNDLWCICGGFLPVVSFLLLLLPLLLLCCRRCLLRLRVIDDGQSIRSRNRCI